MHLRLRSRRLWAALGAAAAVALGTGVAFGSIPDTDGVIHACYNTTSGKIRVTDATNPKLAACLSSKEVALDWNRQGPEGPEGPVGPTGPAGPTGDTGPKGDPG